MQSLKHGLIVATSIGVAIAVSTTPANVSARSISLPSENTLSEVLLEKPMPDLKRTEPDLEDATLHQTSPSDQDELKGRRMQCVKYARLRSGLEIMGNARKWWSLAIGKYTRDKKPALNAVMVLGGTKHGHVAVVSEVLSSREIRIDHANWMNDGKIQKGALVLDVSTKNDWSKVRVWYPPLKDLGTRGYPVYGFILPKTKDALDQAQAGSGQTEAAVATIATLSEPALQPVSITFEAGLSLNKTSGAAPTS